MRIISVRITKENKVSIQYHVKNNSSWDEFSMTSCDAPLQSFINALDSLKEEVVKMCEFPEKDKDSIIVRGVTYSYGGDNETMGATIIAQKKLLRSNSNLNINTPHKASDYYSGGDNGDPNQLLSHECVGALNDVMDECEKYINGERQQLQLDLKPKPE